MNSSEREKPAAPRPSEPAPAPRTENASGREDALRAMAALSRRPAAPRFTGERPAYWVLPASNGTWWAVAADPKHTQKAAQAPPKICAPKLDKSDKIHASDACLDFISTQFTERIQADGFQLLRRAVLGGGLLLAGLVGLRISEDAKFVPEFLVLGASAFLFYTMLRYGIRFFRSLNDNAHATTLFADAEFAESPLTERLGQALAFRASLKHDQRGESPDDELLDTNAYRKLIREGVTNAKELATLGAAIDARLQLNSDSVRKFSDIARDAAIDTEAAIFYRDLAQAAKEISLEVEFQ